MTDISEVLILLRPHGAERTGSPSTNKVVSFAFRHLRSVSEQEVRFPIPLISMTSGSLEKERTTNISQDTEKSPYNRRVGSQRSAMKNNKRSSLFNLYQIICW